MHVLATKPASPRSESRPRPRDEEERGDAARGGGVSLLLLLAGFRLGGAGWRGGNGVGFGGCRLGRSREEAGLRLGGDTA